MCTGVVILGTYNQPHLSDLKMHMYFDPVVQFLPFYLISIGVLIPTDNCMRVGLFTVYVTTKKQKPSKYLSIKEMVNKLWYL